MVLQLEILFGIFQALHQAPIIMSVETTQAMGGTIVVSAYSGATFSVGQTVTGGTSGASGTISFLGENFLRIATVTSGSFPDQ